LTSAHNSNDGRIYFRQCISLLEKTNYRVILAAYGDGPSNPNLEFYSLGERPRKRLSRVLRSQINAMKALRSIRADLWHLHDPELLVFGFFLTLFGKKVIWDAHEDYFLQLTKNREYRSYIPVTFQPIVSRIVIGFLKQIDMRASGVVVANETIAQSYSNLNCKIVGNEAPIKKFGNSKPTFQNTSILFLGPLSDERCFPEVVEAIREIENLNLVACGTLQVEDEVQLKNAQAVLGERFIHLGWLDQNQIIEMHSNALIGLAVYKETAAYLDPLANSTKLLEFFASGLPVVATPIPSNVKLIGESSAGILSKGFTSVDLKEAIIALSSSIELWERVAKNGKQWSKANDNWKTSEEKLIEAYLQALS
jgi:glycosyltransferase involved in cell wall biosynthesis